MSVRADTLVLAPTRASRRWREALTGIGLLFPSAALVLAFTIFPVAYNVWLGFYSKHSLRATSSWVGLENYVQIFNDPDFWRSVWLATVYAVGSTAFQIVAGVAGALILHRRFAGCDFLRGVALFPVHDPHDHRGLRLAVAHERSLRGDPVHPERAQNSRACPRRGSPTPRSCGC